MKPIQFRDKRDLCTLPPIPKDLLKGMQELIDTKINGRGVSLFESLEAVYAYMDRFNAFVATFAVCQKGCSHCCKIGVEVSRLEAEYISVKGGPMLDQGSSRTASREGSCPFLGKNGACTIYDRRPFNCRTFHTLDDPKYCANLDEEHQTYGSAGTGYGVTIYSDLARWLDHVHQSRGLPYRDIRDWFPQQPSLIQRLLGRTNLR